MSGALRYQVIQRAREISGDPDLTVLEFRKHLGVPLARDIETWLSEQPPHRALLIDLDDVHAITASVAEELGPHLMQSVQDRPILDQRYPIYAVRGPEPAYTIHRAFEGQGRAALGFIVGHEEGIPRTAILDRSSIGTTVVLGQLSEAMMAILRLADKRWQVGETLTSESLASLEFMRSVGPAARSKRLTELYVRRLLAYRENPRSPRERLFTPAWRLGADERQSVPE